MKKIDVLKIIIVFALISALAYLFPIFGKDIAWSLQKVETISEFLNIANLGIIPNFIIALFTKYKILKILLTAACTTIIFLLMNNIVNKKNTCLLYLSLFLFILIDNTFYSEAFISIEGFAVHMISSLFSLSFIYMIKKNDVTKMNSFILLILGLAFSSLNTTYAFSIFIISLVYVLKEIKEGFKSPKYFYLILGEVIGLVVASFTTVLNYRGFSHNLLEEFIPKITETNFLIILIFSALALFSSVKVLLNGRQMGAIFAITGISSYLFSSLLSSSIYINYITYCLFILSTFYILINISTSRVFKQNIAFYFIFKIVYIVFLSLLGNISYASTTILYLLDILLIIELYDHIFPNEFLGNIWQVAVFLILCSNIYIYDNVAKKYDEMNFYIKNKLECSKEDFTIPSKYKTDYLHDYLPIKKEHYENYIEYFDIDVYETDRIVKISLRE